jgi:hypothetical protein
MRRRLDSLLLSFCGHRLNNRCAVGWTMVWQTTKSGAGDYAVDQGGTTSSVGTIDGSHFGVTAEGGDRRGDLGEGDLG